MPFGAEVLEDGRTRFALWAPAAETIDLVLENEANDASNLRGHYDAQWNDDLHHALHVVLTGESAGYYADYADAPVRRLGRSLGEEFAYQGEPSRHEKKCGEPSANLPSGAFISFVQNHHQIGNRALG
jgi:maltooligosyltrehalose trehalohydrolase